MKTNSLLTLAAVTLAGAASAAVTSANTLCRIEINSGAKSTIVSVPLTKVGATANEAIPVSSLVLTDNLSVGDTILHWNGSAWDAWMITLEGESKTWTPTIVSEGSKNSQTAPAAGTSLARGEAIWVNRSDVSKSFYIYGQVGKAYHDLGSKEIHVTAGTAASPAYTLIGNPQPERFILNGIHPSFMKEGTSPVVGDKVVFVNSQNAFGYTEYTWQNDAKTGNLAWCVKSRYTGDDNQPHIGWTAVGNDVGVAPGEGCWYVSVGGAPVILWDDGVAGSN